MSGGAGDHLKELKDEITALRKRVDDHDRLISWATGFVAAISIIAAFVSAWREKLGLK